MANPRTINLPGSLADTQQYELAPGLIQYVQAVRVVVDNSGGADATPTLSISEQSGVVIADVPQNGVLPAGEADGAATWALRLTDDARAATGGTNKLGAYDLAFTAVPSGSTTPLAFSFAGGDALLDLTTDTRPILIAAGTYIIRAMSAVTELPAHAGKTAMLRIAMLHSYSDQTSAGNSAPLDSGAFGPVMSAAMPWISVAPNDFEVAIDHDAGVSVNFDGAVSVLKIG